MKVHYFAYGSNMLPSRLKERCPSASLVSSARLDGWCFSCTKKGRDGSGKATVHKADNAHLFGVVFALSEADLQALDVIEGDGVGYERVSVSISGIDGLNSGVPNEAWTYSAMPSWVDGSLTPFAWYKALMLAGAMQAELPTSWIGELKSLPALPDPQPERETAHQARRLLGW